jgi:hypothetical protein
VAAAGPATLPAGDAGSKSTDVGGGAAVGTATRSTDGGTGSTGPGAVWTDSDAAATGWTGVVFGSTGEMAPRSIGSRVPALSPSREPGADSAASATSLAMRSAWGRVPAAAAGPIGDIAPRDSVAAGIETGATAAAAGGRTDAASETDAAPAGEVAAATGAAARRTCLPAGCRAALAGETSPCDVSAIESTKPLRSHSLSTVRLRRWRRRCSTCPAPCWRRRSPIRRRSKVTPRRSGRGDATSRRALKVRGLSAFTTNT